jgi:hypothetical protein
MYLEREHYSPLFSAHKIPFSVEQRLRVLANLAGSKP